MKKGIIIGVVILVLAGAGIGYAVTRKKSTPVTTTNTTTQSTAPATTTNDTSSTAPTADNKTTETVITYSDNGFSPASITVKSGSTVTIKNTSSHTMQFDSDPHPAHTGNQELNEGIIGAGKSGSFVVTRTGTFGYHNHLDDSETGTIIVQ